MEFSALPADSESVAELQRLQPSNPFATSAYFEAMRLLGYSFWILGLRRADGKLESGCGAIFRKGRLNHTLEILSLPEVGSNSGFWYGLCDFCHRHGITQLELGTFASSYGTDSPRLGVRSARIPRTEYVLDLSGDLAGMLAKGHRGEVKKAQKAGLTISHTRSPEALLVHQQLMNQSMERRRARGEQVSLARSSPEASALLQSGAGELFQANRGETVFSSVLVLRASSGGYNHSTGSSLEGMKLGASHFLIHHIAIALKSAGADTLNLGGADEGSTLALFKKHFGASPVPLARTSCYVGSIWRYRITRAVELMRSDRGALWHKLIGDWSRLLVYATDVVATRAPEPMPGLEFRVLTDGDLRTLSGADPSFRNLQLERLERFGASYAYGVFADGHIAHVSWLLPPSAIVKDPPRIVPGRTREAEITGCETLPEFRGRGIYPFAIQSLLEVARASGMERVFMKTAPSNKASQVGIEKAGLRRVGAALLVTLPFTNREVIWRRFR